MGFDLVVLVILTFVFPSALCSESLHFELPHYAKPPRAVLSKLEQPLPLLPRSIPDSSVFHITPSGNLQGKDIHVNLYKETNSVRSVPHGEAKFILDEKKIQTPPLSVTLRTGPRFSFSHDSNGTILSVWGRNLSLTPFNLLTHPSIFVNTIWESKSNLNAPPPPHDMETANTNPKQHTAFSGPFKGEEFWNATTMRRKLPSCYKRTPTRVVEIAAAFDSTLCAAHGGNGHRVEAVIRATVSAAEKAFSSRTCIRLKLVHVDGRCEKAKDPYRKFRSYKGKKSAAIVDEFALIWARKHRSVKRDITYLFSGFSDGAMLTGMAYRGATCNMRYGYGWVEGISALLFAHEMGHSLGARHDSKGLMRAKLSRKDGMVLSSKSTREIVKYLDANTLSYCLTPPKKGEDEKKNVTPRGNPLDRKCHRTIPSKMGLQCGKYHLGRISTRLGKVTITSDVQFFKVQVRFRASQGVSLVRVESTLSFFKNSIAANGARRIFAFRPKSRTEMSFGTDIRMLKFPRTGSCCGRKVHISSRVLMYRNGKRIESKKTSFQLRLRCSGKCNPGRRMLKMSSRRKCSICV